MTLVSFVIATKNSEERLIHLLESIKLNCPHSSFEILIADCASTDSTLNIVNTFSSSFPIQVVSYFDTGIYNAWNKAIPYACGKWLVFLGDDDLIFGYEEAHNCFNLLSTVDSSLYPLILFDAFLLHPLNRSVRPTYLQHHFGRVCHFFILPLQYLVQYLK